MDNQKEIDSFINKIIRKSYADKDLSFGEMCADKIATFGGSWTFVISFCIFCCLWIAGNLIFFGFDPYPFILLNLFLSCLAAIQAPIILMSQNRMTNIDRKRDELAYRVDLKAEQEIKILDKKIDSLIIMLENKRTSHGKANSSKAKKNTKE